MFNSIILFACCWSLIGSLSIDSISNKRYVDGTRYTIENNGHTYVQRVSDHGLCTVQLNDQDKTLSEGETIKIKNKWYKVEECQLNRAYPAPCGSKLYNRLRNLTCSLIEQTHNNNNMRQQRQIEDNQIETLDSSSFYNICCESACTISEFLQSCLVK